MHRQRYYVGKWTLWTIRFTESFQDYCAQPFEYLQQPYVKGTISCYVIRVYWSMQLVELFAIVCTGVTAGQNGSGFYIHGTSTDILTEHKHDYIPVDVQVQTHVMYDWFKYCWCINARLIYFFQAHYKRWISLLVCTHWFGLFVYI